MSLLEKDAECKLITQPIYYCQYTPNPSRDERSFSITGAPSTFEGKSEHHTASRIPFASLNNNYLKGFEVYLGSEWISIGLQDQL